MHAPVPSLLEKITSTASLAPGALLQLARECGLFLRIPRKLQPLNFLHSCLLAVSSGSCSLRRQALLAGILGETSLSKQALHKRLGEPSARFMASVLARLLSASIVPQRLGECGSSFRRIIIQDSTCLPLPASHMGLFPGASNGRMRAACARIQCIFELCSEQFLAFGIAPFTRNDQAASGDILELLRPGDLILRDLGYFSIEVLGCIRAASAFFLTRWRYDTCLLDPASGEPLKLLERLQLGRPLDIQLLLGKGHQLPVRLLAFPLPQEVADSRRRKARTDRDRRINHSKEYMALLSWNIFLTNAEDQILPFEQAAQLYALRWRIEIIFKSWKSHLGLRHLGSVGPRQIKTLLCAQLILAVLLHHFFPVAHADSPLSSGFSVLKLAELFASFLLPIFLASLTPAFSLDALSNQILRHCKYEQRKRPNYLSRKSSSLS